MIDKDGNIVTLKEQITKHYCFIKENTALVAIVISIFAAVYKIISDYYFYLINYGYYKYFGIDDTLMLPYNKNSFYQSVGQIAIFIIYWVYAVLSVRTFKLKKQFFEKLLFFVMIPVILSIIWIYDEMITWPFTVIILTIIFLIIFQWAMIFSFGYCMILSFEKEKVEATKRKGSKVNSWGDGNYMILGILLILIGFAMVFFSGYYNSYRKASEKRTFGIVVVNDERYAVIDANEEKLVLQQCEVCGTTLRIDKNTYLCTYNEILINYQTFDNVE